MKKLIALLIALAVMLSALTVLVSADGEEEYVERELTIYEIETAPTIDGVIADGEYHLVSSWPLDKDEFISRGDYVQNIDVEYYMCYDENNLYFAVKTVCDGDHVAVMDNDNKRYVFNAHYLMTLIIPDDPARVDDAGKDVYEAAEYAAKLRFRSVLMTAVTFVLGTYPLVIATGACSVSRRCLGTTVFGGMLVSVVIGTILIPVFFVFVQLIVNKFRKGKSA